MRPPFLSAKTLGTVLALAASFALVALGLGARSQATELSVFERSLSFSTAPLLFAASLLPWFVLVALRTASAQSRAVRFLSLLLRAFVVLLVGLALSTPVLTKRSDALCLVAYLDVSESIDPLEKKRAYEMLRDLAKRSDGEERLFSIVTFAEQAKKTSLFDVEKALAGDELGKLGTNVERALVLGAAGKFDRCGVREVLFTDGRETEGRALEEMLRQKRAGAEIAFFPLRSATPDDLVVERVVVPSRIRASEPFSVEVQVASRGKGSATISLEDEKGKPFAPPRELPEFSGQQIVRFLVTTHEKGPRTFVARGTRAGTDRFSENNRASRSGFVEGPPRVLLVEGSTSASALKSALRTQGFEVEARSPSGLPTSDGEYGVFDFAILSDVPRARVSSKAEERLVRFVSGGKTLFFVGGEASFGPGGWEKSPIEGILPLRSSDSAERQTPSVALALVIDRSGSMAGLPLEMAKQACDESARVLSGGDLVTVIAFDSRPMRAVPLTFARQKERIFRDIMRIKPGGGTEIFGALDAAYQDLSGAEARRKHIVLLTDGVSGADGLTDLARTAFGAGITVTTVGFGSGVNEDLLQAIANAGGGRFHRAEDALHLPRIFTKETESLFEGEEEERTYSIEVVTRARFLAGIEMARAPALLGRNAVELANGAELFLRLGDGTPLLAERAHGAGHVLAWASDLTDNYARRFVGFSEFPRFVAQLLRSHEISPPEEKVLEADVEANDDEVSVFVDATRVTGVLDAAFESTLVVRDGGTGKVLAEKSLVEAAPGAFEARVQRPHRGNLSVEIRHRVGFGAGAETYTSRAEVPEIPPRELSFEDAPATSFEEWSSATRAVISPKMESLWDAHGEPPRVREELGGWLILAALVVHLLDLALRRIAPERVV